MLLEENIALREPELGLVLVSLVPLELLDNDAGTLSVEVNHFGCYTEVLYGPYQLGDEIRLLFKKGLDRVLRGLA